MPARTSSLAKRIGAADGLLRLLQLTEPRDDLTAKHARLTEALRAGVRQGVLRPGAVIPGERELAESLDVSRTTVRRAIKTLVDERLLVQRPGARTCVAQRVEKPASLFAGFSQDMRARGLRPGSLWIKRETGPAVPAEALALSLSPGTLVCRLRRLRTANDVAMALGTSVLPMRFLPDPALVEHSLYAALEKRGTVPVRALQRMRATVAGPAEATPLGVPPGAPLLDMGRRCFNGGGEAVEFCRSLYRGDLYDLLIELS
jgi:GntR family transcriptional regulator